MHFPSVVQIQYCLRTWMCIVVWLISLGLLSKFQPIDDFVKEKNAYRKAQLKSKPYKQVFEEGLAKAAMQQNLL